MTPEQISIAFHWLEEMENVYDLYQNCKGDEPARAANALEMTFNAFYERCHPLLEQIRKNNPEEGTDEVGHS